MQLGFSCRTGSRIRGSTAFKQLPPSKVRRSQQPESESPNTGPQGHRFSALAVCCRSVASSGALSPALRSASSRCSSYDAVAAERSSRLAGKPLKEPIRGRPTAPVPCGRAAGPPLYSQAPTDRHGVLPRAPSASPTRSRPLPSRQAALRRGRSYSPYLVCHSPR